MLNTTSTPPNPGADEFNEPARLFNQGRHQEMEAAARDLTIRFPKHGMSWNALGTALLVQGRSKDAIPPLQRAAKLLPRNADAHNNLGAAFKEEGRFVDAEASLRRALAYKPNYPEALNNLGLTLCGQGRLAESEMFLRQALARKPDYVEAYSNLGETLRKQGRLPESEAILRSALVLNPDFSEAHNNLGNTLRDRSLLPEARASYLLALASNPGCVAAHFNLGTVLKEQGDFDAAISAYRQALSLKPDQVEVHINLAWLMLQLGKCEQAIECGEIALAIKPDSVELHSNLLFAAQHSSTCSPLERLSKSLRFAAQFEAPLRANWRPHRNMTEPDRRLRVGFVSADFRTHPVGFFIAPIWQELDRGQVEVLAYSCHPSEDAWTERLRTLSDAWIKADALSDEQLAQRIRLDRIDILIDLSGHTAHHRLLVFARKPAPIQASWIGFPATTGLTAMDYYLTSCKASTAGYMDSQFVEKLVRLPASSPFAPPADSPEVAPLPALRRGGITFGSFNRMSKISDAAVALWSKVLLAVPTSRLLLGNVSGDTMRQILIERFGACGIGTERLLFHPPMPLHDYLALHGEIDIMLDSFPYNGGTTTRFAFWMGVPVLSLIGPALAQRVGRSLNGALGLDDWAVEQENAYVAKARDAAADLPALAELRAGMRARLAASPLLHPGILTRGLEDALRSMWRRWCMGLDPVAFDAPADGERNEHHGKDLEHR